MAETKVPSLSVFFPAYNEQPNLETLITKADSTISQVAKNYELIVVNDGSTDHTVETVHELQKRFPHLKLISHAENLGYGAALKTGFATAKFDWIFFTDADLQFDIDEIKLLLPFTPDYQVIIGWRKTRAEGSTRAFNAKLFKMYIDLLYRLHVRDIDCAFKLMKRELIQSIHLESTGAFTTAELLYKLKKKGVRVKEVAVSHYPRFMGNPTGAQLRVILKACWESLTLYLKIKSQSLLHH